jgi:competence protein ComEC
MNEWIQDVKKQAKDFLTFYGKVILCGILVFVSLLSVSLIISFISPHKLEVSFLDIGQGDAILIITPSGKQMLVDGGPTQKILEEVSKHISYFDRSIDVIVATHPDADHVTGLIPILEKFKVDTVVLSPSIGHTGIYADVKKHVEDEGADVHIGKAGDVIDFGDGVVAKILYPSKNYVEKKDDTNDASVSMVVTYGEESVLLTGDLPSTEEGELMRAGLPKDITIYKAGHHGSKYSSGEQLLSYIKPEYAVISAGKNNKYGHPNPEAMERLQKYSKEILSTIDKGAITFSMDGKSVNISMEK